MKRSNVFIQSELSSCGACCIESILSFYGGYVPHETVIEDSMTTKSGTSAFNIVKALVKYGFNAYGVFVNLENIDSNHLPIIVHTNNSGYNHFIVIYEIKKDSIIVMDPRVGKYKYSKDDFKRLFTGYAIIAYPLGKIVKYERINTIKEVFMKELFKDKKKIIKLFILSLFCMAISIVPSFYIKCAISFTNIPFLTLTFILLILIKWLLYIIRSHVELSESDRFAKNINKMFMKHIFNLDIGYLSNKRVGEITKKISDITFIKDWFLNLVLINSLDIIILIGGLVLLLLINVKLSLLVVLSLFIYFTITYLSLNKIYDRETDTIYNYNSYSGDITEYLEGLESIKNLGKEDLFLKKINKSYENYLENYKLLALFNAKCNIFKDNILEIMFILMMMIGLIEIEKGLFNVYDLITFNSIYAVIISSYTNIISLLPSFMHVLAKFNGISEFLNIKTDNTEDMKGIKFNSLRIKNLSYSYDLYKNNLNNINLEINRGDKILITGISGVGKSTFVKCLCGYLNDYSGNIILNNEYLRSLKGIAVYLGQEERLFTGTIKENIMLSRCDEEVYENVVKLTNLDSILTNKKDLDNGFLLEAGKNLSGGEKARIILARGLCSAREVLIIDETLSSIGEDDENDILRKLLNIEDLTLLYITHRDKRKFFNKEINFRKDGSYEIRGM